MALGSNARADIARDAYYSGRARRMVSHTALPMHGPVREAPYFPFVCSRCAQGRIPGETVRDQPADQPLVCDTCRAAEREPQGETVRLFEPAPAQLAGQTDLGL